MTTAAAPQISPRPPLHGPCAPPTRAWPTPWSPSSQATPGASTPPSGLSSPAGATRWGCSRCRRATVSSAIAKAHEWAGHESPCRDPGVREALKGWGRQLAKPQRQAGALTADVLAVIRLTAVQPRQRGRGFETAGQAEERGGFDVALVAALSDAGLRRSEAAALTWGDVQRWDDGSGRITVIRSKTDAEAQGAVVSITPAAMKALEAIRPAGVGGGQKVFGLSEVADRPAGEGRSSCRRPGGLGVLQRPQRPCGHGPPQGPERRPYPRDRTPGPLEAGRRYGRSLHPRRIRRVGAALSITHIARVSSR